MFLGRKGHTNVIDWLAEIAELHKENIPPKETRTRAWARFQDAIRNPIPTPERYVY